MSFKKVLSVLTMVCLLTTMFCLTTITSSADRGVLDEVFVETLYNVKADGGAKGDGKTDDATAIKNAVTAANGQGKYSLYFPKGTYYVNSSLTIANTVEVVFAEGAVIKVGAKGKLKLYGNIVAGNYQIFDLDPKSTMSGFNGTAIANPMWFGAKGDGKTDDTQAIQRTMNVFYHINFPYTEEGYLFEDVSFKRSGKLVGADRTKRVKLIAAKGTEKLITLQGCYIEMYSFDIEMEKAPKATSIYFNAVSVLEQNKLEDITTYNAGNSVRDSGANMIITTEFINFKCYKNNDTAFVCNNMWGFMFLKNVLIDYSQSTTKMDFPAITVANNAGMIMTGVEIIGSSNSTANAHGFVSHKSEAMWWEHCTVKNVGGAAFKHTGWPNAHLYFYDCHVENAGINAFLFEDSARYVQIHECTVNGGKGIRLSGSLSQLSNVTVSNVTGNGITSDSTNTVFTGLKLNNNTGYGIVSSGNGCSLVNVSGSGNTSGLTSISGNGSNITTY